MKKIIFLATFLLFAIPTFAIDKEQCVDVEGYWEEGTCYNETYSCPDGYEEFDATTCRKWVEKIDTETTNATCPSNYHLQNAGKCNQRCHRNYNWMQPEHKSAICPTDYTMNNYICSKDIDNSYWDYTDKISNDDGYCDDDVWVETTYKDCEEEKEEPKPIVKKENTFHKDTRCHATKPVAPQWAIKIPADGGILAMWSAMGGSEVEILVNNSNGEWEYNYGISSNDGHEFLPNVSMSQLYKIRVINDCIKGDWLVDP